MDKICLIVLNYNDAETTIKFINNVKSYKNIDHVIVVDNSSTDNSFVELKIYESDKIRVIKTDKNGGYSYGNNFGINYALKMFSPKYIIISNPDVRFDEEIINPMLQAYKKGSQVALVSPRMEYPNGKRAIVAWKLPDWKDNIIFLFNFLNKIYYRLTLYSEKELAGDESFVDVLPGSFFMADVDKLKEIGYFDEETFLYCEEIILSYRLKQAGYKCVLLNNHIYIHDHSVSINKSYNSIIKKYKLLINSIDIYNRKYLKVSRGKKMLFDFLSHMCLMEKFFILCLKSLHSNMTLSKGLLIAVVALSLSIGGCEPASDGFIQENRNDSVEVSSNTDNKSKAKSIKQALKLSFSYNTKNYPYNENFAYFPSLAVWVEDAESGKVKTLYVTKKAAKSFGEKQRPECLPIWFGIRERQKEEGGMKEIDAVSSATVSKKDVELKLNFPKPFINRKINVFMESNLSFDFNDEFRKGESEGGPADKANGQPSLLWKATFMADAEGKLSIPFEIAGHGDSYGRDHSVLSDTSKITTAKDMFQDLKIEYVVN